MQGNNKDADEKQTLNATSPDQQLPHSIFSKDEIRDTVKGFVLAWLRGDINLKFLNANEIMERAKLTNERKDFNQALKEELTAKDAFNSLVSICVGTKEASSEEQKKAISELFSWILTFRSGHRLEGTFMRGVDFEERLHKIEEELESTKNLVYELAMSVRQWGPKHE
jgi:hypothetical protein